ncbi:MAG: D-alanyl-D-alanine carboxypeptidase/D-alanyl-D-alanine-endopeptidase [Bacteroidetes bacterium]|nr:D-alanyl-D-alanine carboxypeptidase/D-alanyl-D-alanine-endopeptidase [Bacteroidota bacterium]
MHHRTFLFLILFLQVGMSQAQTPLDSILDARPLAWWGVMVTDIESGDTLYMRNAERSFMPASVTKLYTTAAVLDQLGPDYQYVTQLFADGIQNDTSFVGNLIVRGAGDPSTGAFDSEWKTLFNGFADSLLAMGIQDVYGDIIGDDNVFDDVAHGADWSWEDLIYGYAAQISGLTFYDATVDIHAYPTTSGNKGRLNVSPEIDDYFTIKNQTITLSRGQSLQEGHHRVAESNEITVSSKIPVGRSDPEVITVHNPTLYFLHALKTVLSSRNIRVHGQIRDIDDLPDDFEYSSSRRIASHTSAPMSELVATVNKNSHNLYAEHLLKTLGHELPDLDEDDDIGSAAMGVAASVRTYAKAEMDTSRIQLVDGSGLSRKNLVTPAMTIGLLDYMASHPNLDVRDAFKSSLAVAGQDGTLEYRFIGNSPGNGRVLAKTGTLGNVSSLAGYVMQDNGSQLAFVIFCNHFQGRHAVIRAIQESLVNSLITSSSVQE